MKTVELSAEVLDLIIPSLTTPVYPTPTYLSFEDGEGAQPDLLDSAEFAGFKWGNIYDRMQTPLFAPIILPGLILTPNYAVKRATYAMEPYVNAWAYAARPDIVIPVLAVGNVASLGPVLPEVLRNLRREFQEKWPTGTEIQSDMWLNRYIGYWLEDYLRDEESVFVITPRGLSLEDANIPYSYEVAQFLSDGEDIVNEYYSQVEFFFRDHPDHPFHRTSRNKDWSRDFSWDRHAGNVVLYDGTLKLIDFE